MTAAKRAQRDGGLLRAVTEGKSELRRYLTKRNRRSA